MPIIPWRPFGDINRWFDEVEPERWFEFLNIPKVRVPRTDIYETDKEMVAKIELPGVKPKDIDISVKNNILSIEAKTEEKKEEKKEGYYKKEIGSRYFKRQIYLPIEVVGEKTEAEYEKGILKVIIPKAKIKKIKKSKVKIKVKQ